MTLNGTYRSLPYLLLLAFISLATIQSVRAQRRDAEVVVVDGAVSSDVFAVLHGALARDGITLRRAADAAACSGTLNSADDLDLRARAWLRWSKHLVTLCFQDRCQSHERVLGPFRELDARAREEVITVISSGFAALSLSCPAQPPPPEVAAPEPVDRSTLAANEPPPTQAATPEAAPERVQPRAAEADAPLQPAAAAPPQAGSRASTRLELDSLGASPDDSATLQNSDDGPPFQRSVLFAARYGVTRWADGVFAQYVGGGAAYALHRYPIFLGFEVDYAPLFRAGADALAIEVSSLRLAVHLWARWSLSERVVLDAQLGPTLDWLWLAPEAATERQLRAPQSKAHADPALFVRVGPALRLHKALSVGLDLQLDGAFVARSYGFIVEQRQQEIFTPDRFRMSIALHARAEL